MDEERQRFEQWYATHALNHERDPIGSRDCGLQWAAWQAGSESHRAELAACREDAERYRWLREHWDDVNHPVDFIICNSFVTTLDADVDAARKGEVET